MVSMHMLLTLLATILSLTVGCGHRSSARAAAVPARAPTSATSVRFAWPTPGIATVTETHANAGKRITMRYDLVINRNTDQSIKIAYKNFEFVDSSGVDLNNPEVRARFARAFAPAAAIPALRVGSDGAFLDVDDLEASIDEIIDDYRGASPEQREQFRALLESPPVRAGLRVKSGGTWEGWVGLWLTNKLPGVGRSTSIANGGRTATIRNHGTGTRGLRLDAEIELVGDSLRAEIEAQWRASQPAAAVPKIGDGSKHTTLAVELDPATMKPYSASRESRTKIELDGKLVETIETHDYEFRWK